MKVIKRSNRGKEVVDVQTRLTRLKFRLGREGVDGVFGPATERAIKLFQKNRGLAVDGIVGEETWHELVKASYKLGGRLLYLRIPFFEGDDVRELQGSLNSLGFNAGPVDGVFGPLTEKALREFQKSTAVSSDGIVGPSTLKALGNLKNVVKSNKSSNFPEETRRTLTSQDLKGKKVVVDFGHGYPPDPGAIGPGGVRESEICEDLGARFGNLVQLLGGDVRYARKQGEFVELRKRAEAANNLRADLFISFHLNGSSGPADDGTSTYYFAQGAHFSAEGKRLAERIQKSLVVALGRKDAGIHGRNFEVLRKTIMPAVLLEPLFITNPQEEKLLQDEAFRQKIAVAVCDGLKEYLFLEKAGNN